MTAWRRVMELAIEDEDLRQLKSIARSRTEPGSRVERARMLLAYRQDPLSSQWVRSWVCIIRRFSAVSNGL
jgi:hypothetical protein